MTPTDKFAERAREIMPWDLSHNGINSDSIRELIARALEQAAL